LERTCFGDRLLRRLGLTHDGDVALGGQASPQCRPHKRVIVGDQNADHGG
jgi:hypothetical protein